MSLFIFRSGNVSKPKSSGIKAKTPFVLFAENNTDEESDFNKLREKYANMSMEEKYKWVIKAVSLAPEVFLTLLFFDKKINISIV